MNLSILYLSAVEESCFFSLAFCCTCKRILPEPRVGIFIRISRVMSLQRPSSLCYSIGHSNVIYFFRCKKTKSHLVLFVTSTILPRRQGCWGKIVPSHYRYSLQKLLSSTPCCYQRLRFTFSLLMRCFPFSANVKPIDAIRVQRRTHVSSFFNEEKRNGIFFPVTHSMLLQFEETNKKNKI